MKSIFTLAALLSCLAGKSQTYQLPRDSATNIFDTVSCVYVASECDSCALKGVAGFVVTRRYIYPSWYGKDKYYDSVFYKYLWKNKKELPVNARVWQSSWTGMFYPNTGITFKVN